MPLGLEPLGERKVQKGDQVVQLHQSPQARKGQVMGYNDGQQAMKVEKHVHKHVRPEFTVSCFLLSRARSLEGLLDTQFLF